MASFVTKIAGGGTPVSHGHILVIVLLHLSAAEGDVAVDGDLVEKIVGGEDGDSSSAPWLVWVGKQNELQCHGALIREDLVLTSRSCAKKIKSLSRAFAYIGYGNRDEEDENNPTQKIKIKGRKSMKSFGNFVILVLVERANTEKNEVKNVDIIRVATDADVEKITSDDPPECFVAGWGLKATGAKGRELITSAKLQLLDVEFSDVGECKQRVRRFNKKEDLCYLAGDKEGPCDGDEGAPYACYIDNGWVMVGMENGKRQLYPKQESKKCRGGWVGPLKVSKYYTDIQKRLDDVYEDVSVPEYPTDCEEAMNEGKCNGTEPCELSLEMSYGYKNVEVMCDQTTDGGGWTILHSFSNNQRHLSERNLVCLLKVIQKRFDGSEDFYRPFMDYEYGFGSASGEYWLGLKWIRALTKAGNTDMRIHLVSENNGTAYQVFSDFKLGQERGYKLKVGSSSGTAGDQSGFERDAGSYFSTYDNDQDPSVDLNLAEMYHTGWWLSNEGGSFVNLNGYYDTPGTISTEYTPVGAFTHLPFNGLKSLRGATIMIRKP